MNEKQYTYKYPHPSVTTDCVIFGFDGKTMHLLLIERGLDPYKGMWALPGGFLKMDESAEECALRELQEETGLSNIYVEQFHTFSAVDRDPRERVLTVAFMALVNKEGYALIAGDDAARAEWFEWDTLPPLAFDHDVIIGKARERLAELLRLRPIAFKLLDKEFKMSELQRLYELINGTKYDRRNFQRKMMSSGFIYDANAEESICDMDCEIGSTLEATSNGVQRFSFDEEAYKKEEKKKTWRKYPFDFK